MCHTLQSGHLDVDLVEYSVSAVLASTKWRQRILIKVDVLFRWGYIWYPFVCVYNIILQKTI